MAAAAVVAVVVDCSRLDSRRERYMLTPDLLEWRGWRRRAGSMAEAARLQLWEITFRNRFKERESSSKRNVWFYKETVELWNRSNEE